MKLYLQNHLVQLQVLVVLPIVAAAQVSSPAAAIAAKEATGSSALAAPVLLKREAGYQLRKGDSLDLAFALCPEFNQTVTVQPDGYINLKAAGQITVLGMTLSNLAETINTAYKSILNNPRVAVSLTDKDIDRPYFIAAGQVAHPGKYDLKSITTVFQAVSIAGGFTDSAKHSQVVLYRLTLDDGYVARVVNVKKLLAEHDLNQDIRLQSGDTLYVPKSTLGNLKPYLPGTNVFLNPLSY